MAFFYRLAGKMGLRGVWGEGEENQMPLGVVLGMKPFLKALDVIAVLRLVFI